MTANIPQGMILHPFGGLCNRLSLVMSARVLSQTVTQPLSVYWCKNSEVCNAHFLDVFAPLKGVRFLNTKPSDDSKLYFHKGCGPDKDLLSKHLESFPLSPHRPEPMAVSPLARWHDETHSSYLDLKPKKQIKIIIDSFKNAMGTYISIHVRRKDHPEFLKANGLEKVPYKKFEQFIDSHPSNKKIFLATDDSLTQEYFKNKYGDRLTFYSPIINSDELRNTSLHDAVVDLYICSYARYFMGTEFSTFSYLIKALNKARNVWDKNANVGY